MTYDDDFATAFPHLAQQASEQMAIDDAQPTSDLPLTVGYRTEQMTVICLACADTIDPRYYDRAQWTPIYQPEAEQLCDDGEDECAECERCIMDVASRYPK